MVKEFTWYSRARGFESARRQNEKNSRQKKQTQQPQPAQQPLIELNPVRSGPITLNRSLSATNPSVVVPREPVQRSLSFSTANPRGSKIGATSIVNSNPATPQTPGTPGSPGDIDLDDDSFAVPESPASTAGGSKVRYFRKVCLLILEKYAQFLLARYHFS